jgi:nucleoside permease NupC
MIVLKIKFLQIILAKIYIKLKINIVFGKFLFYLSKISFMESFGFANDPFSYWIGTPSNNITDCGTETEDAAFINRRQLEVRHT